MNHAMSVSLRRRAFASSHHFSKLSLSTSRTATPTSLFDASQDLSYCSRSHTHQGQRRTSVDSASEARSSGRSSQSSTQRSSTDEESKQTRSAPATSVLQIIAWLPVFLFFTSHVYGIGQVHGASMSVPLGLVTSKISFVLWPLTRFGPPLPRPTPDPKVDHARRPNRFSELDPASSTSSMDLLSKEVTRALDEAYLKVKEGQRSPSDSDDRSELIATSSANHISRDRGPHSKKIQVPVIQEDDGEEEIYEVDSILSPYATDATYVKGNSRSNAGGSGWGKKLTEQDLEREKAERRRESLNKWSRGGKLGDQ